MSMPKVWFVVMVFFAVLETHQWAYAQNITVDFIKDDGTAACAQKSGATPLTIGGACGPITLSANTKVVILDGGSDYIRLFNGTITANSPVNNFHIIFKRQFVQGPNTSAGPPVVDVNYKTAGDGSFFPARDGNAITAVGYVTNVPTDPEQTMGSIAYIVSGGVGTFSSLRADKLWPRTAEGELANDRVLRVDMGFKLQNANDILDLTTNGVKLYNAAPGEPCPGCHPTDCPHGKIGHEDCGKEIGEQGQGRSNPMAQ